MNTAVRTPCPRNSQCHESLQWAGPMGPGPSAKGGPYRRVLPGEGRAEGAEGLCTMCYTPCPFGR